MKRIPYTLTGITLSVLLTALSGCSSDSDNDDNEAQAREVTIPFAAKSGTQDIVCDTTLNDLGTTAASATLKNFAFYVHDVVLMGDDNNEYPVTLMTANNDWQYENVTLLDFQDKDNGCDGVQKETNTEVNGTVTAPEDTEMVGIKFKVGVPFGLNHGENAVQTSPLNLPHLYWNWQGGYKYARLDVQPVAGINGDTSKVHNIHLGATGCVSSGPTTSPTVECSNPNIPVVDIDFNLATQAVKIDYAQLVATSNINSDNGVKDGCMSFPNDPECPVIFDQLGMDYEASVDLDGQVVFSSTNL